ncbi:uncharacterized protein LOC112086687 [Eutrema salsugineum]|uniref:uncharacterized protein LOC112086687 n=1 Tax=Eutrema salsugineum TaxID=72664 RepID=UPI000CED5C5E|nr:uncharacterized protein LOC112086687 [Eutrema salsugineum]
MPPRTMFKKKGKKKNGEGSKPTPSTYPWPREENTLIELPDELIPEQSDEQWDQTDSFYYNKLLNIKLQPTLVMCTDTLKRLGIFDEVSIILRNTKLTQLAFEDDDLYPDLVRQCLASAKLRYANPTKPKADEATFTFFAEGKRYSIDMATFCTAYGFHDEDKELRFPSKFEVANQFWQTIASGHYKSNTASISVIRHPAVRICAKIFNNMLFNRDSGNKVALDVLMLPYFGCGDLVADSYSVSVPVEHSINFGVQLAQTICAVRTKPFGSSQVIYIGSLLTALFTFAHIPLRYATKDVSRRRMDTAHLLTSGFLCDENTYSYKGAYGVAQRTPLPNPAMTALNTAANLRFLMEVPLLADAAHDGAPAPNSGAPVSSSGAPARASSSCYPHSPQRDEELPDYVSADAGEFDLAPISDDPDDAEFRRWMVASTKKNNSLMKRLLQMLTSGYRSSTATAASSPERHPRRRRRTGGSGSESPEDTTTH